MTRRAMSPAALSAAMAVLSVADSFGPSGPGWMPKPRELKAAQREQRDAARLARAPRLLARAEAKRGRKNAKRVEGR